MLKFLIHAAALGALLVGTSDVLELSANAADCNEVLQSGSSPQDAQVSPSAETAALLQKQWVGQNSRSNAVTRILIKDSANSDLHSVITGYVLKVGKDHFLLDTGVTIDFDLEKDAATFKPPAKPARKNKDRVVKIPFSQIASAPDAVRDVSPAQFWEENVSKDFTLSDHLREARTQKKLAENFLKDGTKVARVVLKSGQVVIGHIVGSFANREKEEFLQIDTGVRLDLDVKNKSAKFKSPPGVSKKWRLPRRIETIAISDILPMSPEKIELTPESFWKETVSREFSLEDYLALGRMGDDAEAEYAKERYHPYRLAVADRLNQHVQSNHPIRFQIIGADEPVSAHVVAVEHDSASAPGRVLVQKIKGNLEDLDFNASKNGDGAHPEPLFRTLTSYPARERATEQFDLGEIQLDSIEPLNIAQAFPEGFTYGDYLHYGKMYPSLEEAERRTREEVDELLLKAYNNRQDVIVYYNIEPPIVAAKGKIGKRFARLTPETKAYFDANLGVPPETIQIQIGHDIHESAPYVRDLVRVELLGEPHRVVTNARSIPIRALTSSEKTEISGETPSVPLAEEDAAPLQNLAEPGTTVDVSFAHEPFEIEEEHGHHRSFRRSIATQKIHGDERAYDKPISNVGPLSLVRYEDSEGVHSAIIADYSLDGKGGLQWVRLLQLDRAAVFRRNMVPRPGSDDANAGPLQTAPDLFIFKELHAPAPPQPRPLPPLVPNSLSENTPRQETVHDRSTPPINQIDDFHLFATSFQPVPVEEYEGLVHSRLFRDLIITPEDAAIWNTLKER